MAFRLLKNLLTLFAILVVVVSSLLVVYIVNVLYAKNIDYGRSSSLTKNYKLFFFNTFERSTGDRDEYDIGKSKTL